MFSPLRRRGDPFYQRSLEGTGSGRPRRNFHFCELKISLQSRSTILKKGTNPITKKRTILTRLSTTLRCLRFKPLMTKTPRRQVIENSLYVGGMAGALNHRVSLPFRAQAPLHVSSAPPHATADARSAAVKPCQSYAQTRSALHARRLIRLSVAVILMLTAIAATNIFTIARRVVTKRPPRARRSRRGESRTCSTWPTTSRAPR